MKNAGFLIAIGLIAAAFWGLLAAPEAALAGAGKGLSVCAGVILPNLLPFLVLSGMLTGLGLPQLAGRCLGPLTERLFALPGAVAAPFLLGLCGGYPMGAGAVAELVHAGVLRRKEGERALAFCNNTGPAFILGAAGIGAFGSTQAGLLLWACHALAALLLGILLSCGKRRELGGHTATSIETPRPPAAVFVESMKKAVAGLLNICGFVVFFSVVRELLEAAGLFSAAAGRLSEGFDVELRFSRALLTGILELGSGISALRGLAPVPRNLALASFLLGFGGLSVHCQALSAAEEAELHMLPHFFGKLLQGGIAALLTLLFCRLGRF